MKKKILSVFLSIAMLSGVVSAGFYSFAADSELEAVTVELLEIYMDVAGFSAVTDPEELDGKVSYIWTITNSDTGEREMEEFFQSGSMIAVLLPEGKYTVICEVIYKGETVASEPFEFYMPEYVPVSISDLIWFISEAEALNPWRYTKDSWEKVQDALDEAYDIYYDVFLSVIFGYLPEYSQEDIDEAAANLNLAIEALEQIGAPDFWLSILDFFWNMWNNNFLLVLFRIIFLI
ncbi:MAG: hypothetical protein FWF08_08430 [Oscillospiraceae bacterium]|nr:hypothetical protein [Oscillospiraceae bacterium]